MVVCRGTGDRRGKGGRCMGVLEGWEAGEIGEG